MKKRTEEITNDKQCSCELYSIWDNRLKMHTLYQNNRSLRHDMSSRNPE